ncbi:MAG: hypothetical protein KF862_26440 [Chitinophagaceae bacterium]|nr:hypothetical protein [Chitinophagaceae bacterium]
MGEIWLDLPGYEGEYEISSYGRVKSLRRWRNCGVNSGYYTKELIRRQYIRTSANERKKDFTYSVGITLKKGGKNFSTSTARLVYITFVKEFDLNDKTQVVTYIDNNGRNISYRNLALTTHSGKTQKSIALKRNKPYLLNSKIKVRQLTIEGKLVASYNSIKEASNKTGLSGSAISACMRGKIFHHHQFRWEHNKRNSKQSDKVEGIVFNNYLWKKIGSPKVNKKNPPAALNLSILSMPGEKWKIIKTAENYYVSNFGRIKIKPHFKFNYQVWQKEKILRLVPDGNANKATSCLLASISIKGKKKQVSVARLVYSNFVSAFDLDNKTIKVKYKNGCCYDLNANNLCYSGVQQRSQEDINLP